MEFKFDINSLFREPIVEINNNLIPPGFCGDRRQLMDTVMKVTEVVNALGESSAAAQGLTKPITTADRLRNSEHKLYLLVDNNANNGRGAVTGMLKTGKKGLYIFDRNGQHYQVSPPCVLDFYVHESRQRHGLGKQLFEHMLQKEEVHPVKMAIDRPSNKFLGFLNKHYSLQEPIKQMNNYVVFDGFFPNEKNNGIENGGATTDHSGGGNNNNNNSATSTPSGGKKANKSNGLQPYVSSPYGRYGAPRPQCSMGQIIHNQSATLQNSPEPTGVSSEPYTNYQQQQQMIPSNQQQQQLNYNSQSVPNFINLSSANYHPHQVMSNNGMEHVTLMNNYYQPQAQPQPQLMMPQNMPAANQQPQQMMPAVNQPQMMPTVNQLQQPQMMPQVNQQQMAPLPVPMETVPPQQQMMMPVQNMQPVMQMMQPVMQQQPQMAVQMQPSMQQMEQPQQQQQQYEENYYPVQNVPSPQQLQSAGDYSNVMQQQQQPMEQYPSEKQLYEPPSHQNVTPNSQIVTPTPQIYQQQQLMPQQQQQNYNMQTLENDNISKMSRYNVHQLNNQQNLSPQSPFYQQPLQSVQQQQQGAAIRPQTSPPQVQPQQSMPQMQPIQAQQQQQYVQNVASAPQMQQMQPNPMQAANNQLMQPAMLDTNQNIAIDDGQQPNYNAQLAAVESQPTWRPDLVPAESAPNTSAPAMAAPPIKHQPKYGLNYVSKSEGGVANRAAGAASDNTPVEMNTFADNVRSMHKHKEVAKDARAGYGVRNALGGGDDEDVMKRIDAGILIYGYPPQYKSAGVDEIKCVQTRSR